MFCGSFCAWTGMFYKIIGVIERIMGENWEVQNRIIGKDWRIIASGLMRSFHGSHCVQHKSVVCTAGMPVSINVLRSVRKGMKHFLWRDSTTIRWLKSSEYMRTLTHLEARLKCKSPNNPPIQEQLSTQGAKVQENWRLGLVKQLEAMKFLLRQGIALRSHSEKEGNLQHGLS